MSEERVEVKVTGVFMHREEGGNPPQHFVLLRDKRGRRLPIWIGQFEAWAISFALEGDVPERPLTHNLMLTLLLIAGASITEAAIVDLRNETFYATVTLCLGAKTRDVDSRPSDAIILALQAKRPIFVTEAVMGAAARNDGESFDSGLEEAPKASGS